MFRKSVAILALASCAMSAFALPKPSEVNAAFNAGKYEQAESMLKEVLAAKQSAPAHYKLGQVYAAENRHALAVSEFREAAKEDGALRFASSPAAFNTLLSKEQQLANAPAPARMVPSPIAIPQQYNTVAAANPVPVPTVQQGESSGHGFAIFLIVLVLVVGGIAAAMFFGKKKEDQLEKTAHDKDANQQKANLLDMSKDLEDAILIAKTSAITDSDRYRILQSIGDFQKSVRSRIAELKDGKLMTSSQLNNLAEMVEQIKEQAQHGIPVAAPAPAHDDSSLVAVPLDIGRPLRAGYPSVVNEGQATVRITPAPVPAPAPTVIHHHYDAPPAPVIVNNSGNDFTTGLILGEMMSQPRERVVERTVYVEERTPVQSTTYQEQPRMDSNDSDDSWSAPAPSPAPVEEERYSAPTMDTSNDDNSWSSDSGSSDSGSSDSSDSY